MSRAQRKSEAPAVLVLAFATACSAPRRGQATEQASDITHCSVQQRAAAICTQIGRSLVIESNGKSRQIDLNECVPRGRLATVRWSTSEGQENYRGVIKLGPSTPGMDVSSVDLQPLVLSWPCESNCTRTRRRIRIPVLQECSVPASWKQAIELPVPAVNRSSCAAEAWLTGGNPKWCSVSTPPGTSVFWIRRWSALSRGAPWSARAVVRGEYMAVTANGQEVQLAPEVAEGVRQRLESAWKEPPEAEESCRDSALTVVEVLETGRWRVLLRHCLDVVGVEQLVSVTTGTPSPAPQQPHSVRAPPRAPNSNAVLFSAGERRPARVSSTHAQRLPAAAGASTGLGETAEAAKPPTRVGATQGARRRDAALLLRGAVLRSEDECLAVDGSD